MTAAKATSRSRLQRIARQAREDRGLRTDFPPAVADWLAGTRGPPPRVVATPGLAEQLLLQDRVARTMKGLRHHHGALELDTMQARPVFDGDTLAALRPDRQDRAQQLIDLARARESP